MTDETLSIETVELSDRDKAVAEAKELLSLRKRQPEYLINHTVYDALLQRLVN